MDAAVAETKGGAIYITDMSAAVARSSRSLRAEKGSWLLMPYETTDPDVGSGTMIGAASFNVVPEARLPMGVSGWHAIYIGYWNLEHDYDGPVAIKVKLSDDSAFTCIKDAEPPAEVRATYLKEAFYKSADLTGRELIFGKVSGQFPHKSFIAYVKLVPLSSAQVLQIEADRAAKEKRVLQATIDGISYLGGNEYDTEEHILELVERYRDADVSKVIWAFNYGNFTNYPSKIGTFLEPTLLPDNATPTGGYAAFEKAWDTRLKGYFAKGIVPQSVVADYAHKMGLKFDAMFRFACGGLPPRRAPEDVFLTSHPECRQVLQNGTVIEKASMAFPEVRDQMLSIIREVAQGFDIDGAQISFVRGFHFLQYEKPVLDLYRKEYGEAGTNVEYDDPRMQKVRATFMTAFMRDVRELLNEVGAKKGRKIELSAWVATPHIPYIMDGGMDVVTWLREGLLDSILPYSDLAAQPDVLLDGNNLELIELARANGCKYIRAYNLRGNSVEHMFSLAKACLAGYDQGVDGFAIWDVDGHQDTIAGNYQWWQLGGKLGHRDMLDSFVRKTITSGKSPMEINSVKLKSINGHDVLSGLWDVAYSGG